MNTTSIAPCGLICDLCHGFQRTKNTCAGCNSSEKKTKYCTVCRIKTCPEKSGNETLLCNSCGKFPCKRLKDLEKRYMTRYGESPIENLQRIAQIGMESFVYSEKEKWKCNQCSKLLCVHKNVCLGCGAKNGHFPGNE